MTYGFSTQSGSKGCENFCVKQLGKTIKTGQGNVYALFPLQETVYPQTED